MAAQAKSQAGARLIGRKPNGGEHMRRFDGARRARRARRACQSLEVESNDQRLALNPWKRNIGGVWRPRRPPAPPPPIPQTPKQTLLQLGAPTTQTPPTH